MEGREGKEGRILFSLGKGRGKGIGHGEGIIRGMLPSFFLLFFSSLGGKRNPKRDNPKRKRIVPEYPE